MKIYYLLYEQYSKIVGVFDTLYECFEWKPEGPLQKPVVIKEVKRMPNGTFQIHDIQTSEHHWANADKKLKNYRPNE